MRNRKLLILFGIFGFVVVLVIVNSIIFYIRKVEVDILNIPDAAYAEDVRSAADVNGGSIFLLNEKSLIGRIESKVTSARVINIERIFPDKIVIHVVKKAEYGYIEQDGKFVVVDNDMRVLSVESERPVRPLVRIYIDKDKSNPDSIDSAGIAGTSPSAVGAVLQTVRQTEVVRVLTELMHGIERLNYADVATVFIDSVYVYSMEEQIYIKMAGSSDSSTVINISGTANIIEKFRRGMSLYVEGNGSDVEYARRGGVITVFADANNVIKVTYAKDKESPV
jgi:hypothetical protein